MKYEGSALEKMWWFKCWILEKRMGAVADVIVERLVEVG